MFKGICLEAETLADNRLSMSERVVWSYMMSLKDFHAGDAHIAKCVNMPIRTIERIMASLRRKGYVTGKNNTRKPCHPNHALMSSELRNNECRVISSNKEKGISKDYSLLTVEMEQSKQETPLRPAFVPQTDFGGVRLRAVL